MLIGAVFLIGGMVLVIWGAERFTDGAVAAATRFGLSTFYVGAVLSGFEPENLVTGVAASAQALPQIALGTVIGSAVFMLTGGLGLALVIVPMAVSLPREGIVAMVAATAAFGAAVWNDGMVTRFEGAALVLAAVAIMIWLSMRSPIFSRAGEPHGDPSDRRSASRAVAILVVGVAAMVAGAELLVHGVRMLLVAVLLSETFLGMTVIGLGESLEETARMVSPARRGHPELAWGNVVGTIIVLLAFNLGVIALTRPVTVDPFVLWFHAPYLAGCALVVAAALSWARTLGRRMGLLLIALYVISTWR